MTTDAIVIRVSVELPASVTDNGEPVIFSETSLMSAKDFRLTYPGKIVPDAIQRASRALMFALRWSD